MIHIPHSNSLSFASVCERLEQNQILRLVRVTSSVIKYPMQIDAARAGETL